MEGSSTELCQKESLEIPIPTAGQSQSANDGSLAPRLIPPSSQSNDLAKEKFQLGHRCISRKQLSAAVQTLRPESTQKRSST